MAMEINGLNSNQVNSNKARGGQKVGVSEADAKKTTAQTETANAETVKISPEAQALNRVSQQMETDAPVNQDKVEALKAALADGSYKINAQSIARKMLESDSLF
ncbi:flagellar biosynthesis anti-sigma factor FlgM [Ketobacter sp.]|uniref:flagellar biosynthesis anti-sigma factor FlgM n=1 Tax=Ketobacter sp. TaxID=2083498 RepID=UPI000F24CFCE|nr:flagellar biosynthesis anti-sigma factor FlgM [Ketobacter sp.]RLT92592.1 MAG: flagellar biosynthesis anti-sigma factor FlgM [Ketobacter sp.]